MNVPIYRKTFDAGNARHEKTTPPAVTPVFRATAGLPETSDHYPVIARLNPKWRVIACRDGLQWILQTRSGHRDGLPRWDNRYFYRSREGLVCGCREYAGEIAGDGLVILLRLPPFFPTSDRIASP